MTIHLATTYQGSKLTLANSQNASDFDNLRVRKISTSKRLRVRIIHVSQTKGNKLLVVSPVCQWKKILLAKLCKCTKKITSSPAYITHTPLYHTIFSDKRLTGMKHCFSYQGLSNTCPAYMHQNKRKQVMKHSLEIIF